MIKDWQGKFGDEYTLRNDYDPSARQLFFDRIIPKDVYFILEVGCNRGKNLDILAKKYTVFGVEPNDKARMLAKQRHPFVYPGMAEQLPFRPRSVDLVLTCGVLMHIPDKRLPNALENIWRVTRKYALIIEYQGDNEAVTYRGKHGMLWKRKTYSLPGKLVASGDLGKEFDHCHYWLYRKGG